ncbi:pentapeptide repeat-containing protein [Dictyobacter arantiisoli]|uniref:Pentapeptide repeat-containing protein n=1 Tax=Dictyobacter arantiisoli TaxID=2014874 RepID=A0A5A5TJV1_9CHLR|nr:pentapeptide repeat-containing protein [Dictyobacter arantiisoli]GCF11309.1 hypothetical protein KDI_48730 [Dictyobacter arantiisoli]
MANPKHLAMLASGKNLWNKWRREFPDVQALEPDLHGADLRNVNLHGIDLHGADLTETNLQGADLSYANLIEADLRNARLSGVDLSDANLYKARLHWADLHNANLCHTNLVRADFSNADLRGADLSGADMNRTITDNAKFDESYQPGGEHGKVAPQKSQDTREKKPVGAGA